MKVSAPEAPSPAQLAHVDALRPALEALYQHFDYAQRLEADPLGLVHAAAPADRELVGFIAAAFAYGRVDLFLPKLRALFGWMIEEAGGVRRFVEGFEAGRHRAWLGAFRYRVTSGAHLGRLVEGLRILLERHGSLEGAFAAGMGAEDEDVGPGLGRFVAEIYGAGSAPDRGLKHLVPSPLGGSACKRLNLWLRWMVRRQGGVDLGLWTAVRPSQLILPLDTHTARMSYNLGLTHREDLSWRTASEVTALLRRMDPLDPVKYDFALCHLAMAGGCPARRRDEICGACGLHGLCRWW